MEAGKSVLREKFYYNSIAQIWLCIRIPGELDKESPTWTQLMQLSSVGPKDHGFKKLQGFQYAVKDENLCCWVTSTLHSTLDLTGELEKKNIPCSGHTYHQLS